MGRHHEEGAFDGVGREGNIAIEQTGINDSAYSIAKHTTTGCFDHIIANDLLLLSYAHLQFKFPKS